MNILILGATGRVGGHVLAHALRDRHSVTALVRNPEKIQTDDDNLNVIEGNVLNKDDVTHSMDGVDAVISAISTDRTDTLTESIPIIIKAMEGKGVKRIITIGTAGILDSRTTPGILRYQSDESKRRTTRAAEEHHRFYENLEQSPLEWTIVCPTYLPDGERTGQYRIARNVLPEDGSKISVQDTAEFAYSQLESSEYIHTRIGIAY